MSQVKIMKDFDPYGKRGPKVPLPDVVKVLEPKVSRGHMLLGGLPLCAEGSSWLYAFSLLFGLCCLSAPRALDCHVPELEMGKGQLVVVPLSCAVAVLVSRIPVQTSQHMMSSPN